MDAIYYALARSLVFGLQCLPLICLALLGQAGGAVCYFLDGRHRRIALKNLELAFGTELDAQECRRIARRNFRQIGEVYLCALKTASMPETKIRRILDVEISLDLREELDNGDSSRVFALGHFGNFELFAKVNSFLPGYRLATTFRGLQQPWADRLIRRLRDQTGCLFIERRTEGAKLRRLFGQSRILVGFLADQNAGRRGLRIPFLGHDCSTTPAPALFALRYRLPLHTATCHRTGLGRWTLRVGPEIPTLEEGKPRPIGAITRDINGALEEAVRRNPANWFWVHNRWKSHREGRRPASRHKAGTNSNRLT